MVLLDSFLKYLVARVNDKSCLIAKFHYKENNMNSGMFAYVSRILFMEYYTLRQHSTSSFWNIISLEIFTEDINYVNNE